MLCLIYFVSLRFFIFRFVSLYFVSFCDTSFFVSFRCISFRFFIFRFVSLYFVSFRFISFLSLVVPEINTAESNENESVYKFNESVVSKKCCFKVKFVPF